MTWKAIFECDVETSLRDPLELQLGEMADAMERVIDARSYFWIDHLPLDLDFDDWQVEYRLDRSQHQVIVTRVRRRLG